MNEMHENSNAASESDINLHRVYTGRERRGATQQNTVELIMISDADTGCSAARQIPNSKLLTRSIYNVLTQSSNDLQCFVASSGDTMWQQKHGKCEVKKSGHGK